MSVQHYLPPPPPSTTSWWSTISPDISEEDFSTTISDEVSNVSSPGSGGQLLDLWHDQDHPDQLSWLVDQESLIAAAEVGGKLYHIFKRNPAAVPRTSPYNDSFTGIPLLRFLYL